MYVNNNPVPDFIVVVSNFVVGFPTLLLFDNKTKNNQHPPYSTVTDFARFLG